MTHTYTHCSLCGEKFETPTTGFLPGAEVSHMRCAARGSVEAQFTHSELLDEINKTSAKLDLDWFEEFGEEITYEICREEKVLCVCEDLVDLYLELKKIELFGG